MRYWNWIYDGGIKNSNTTLVKVKLAIAVVVKLPHCIQIQHLLKLNSLFMISNSSGAEFKYNTC